MQIRLVRNATVAKRLALMRSLSKTAISLSRNAIAKANPSLSEREADLLFLRLHYGDRIADWIASCMKEETK